MISQKLLMKLKICCKSLGLTMGVSAPAQDGDEGHVAEAVVAPVVGDLRDEALVPDQWLPREVPQQIMRDLDSY